MKGVKVMTTKVKEKRKASVFEALIPIIGAVAILLYSSMPLFTTEFMLHISLSFGVLLAAVVAILLCGHSWGDLEESMVKSIRNVMNLLIFIAAFNLFISSSIVAGTLPSLVYYLTGNAAIAEAYKITFIGLIIPIIIIAMIVKKVPVVPSLVLGVFLNAFAAAALQGTKFADIVVNIHYGGALETGSAILDKIISRVNGYDASLWLISLIIITMMLVATLQEMGFLKSAKQ